MMEAREDRDWGYTDNKKLGLNLDLSDVKVCVPFHSALGPHLAAPFRLFFGS